MNREEEISKATTEMGFLSWGETMFRAGAKWADENPRKGLVDIEKVCNFLSNIDIKKYTSSITDGVGFVNIHIGDIIEDMKKSMEE